MIVTVTNTKTARGKIRGPKQICVYYLYRVGSISILAIICYYIKIILSGWGAGLFITTIILVNILYNNGNNSWSIILLGKIRYLFPDRTHSGNERLWYTLILFIVLSENLIGLYMCNQHMLLTSMILALLKLVLVLWLFSYRIYFSRGWKYLAGSLIINIGYPSLSFLLSNIEMLTHLFRPVTLMARIWVNIWVGHCMLTLTSFIIVKRLSGEHPSMFVYVACAMAQSALFLYEIIIVFLQSSVIVYLSFIFYRDNLKSTSNH